MIIIFLIFLIHIVPKPTIMPFLYDKECNDIFVMKITCVEEIDDK